MVDLTQTCTDENGIAVFAANPGGAPANVAVAAVRMGAEASFIGCVGEDSFGPMLRKVLIENGVSDKGLQTTEKASTTLAVVSVDKNGERSFSFCRAPGADTCIDLDRALKDLEGCGLLHFGSVSLSDEHCRSVIIRTVEEAKKRGILISYDPNYRASLWKSRDEAIDVMRSVLPLCNIVKISDEETELMADRKDPSEAAEAISKLGVKLVLVTLGADGALWRFGGEYGVVPGFKVKVADTNGAGDSFFGTVLSCVAKADGLDGLTPDRINGFVLFANRAASITASRPGAIPALPYYDEVMEALK